MPFHCCNVIEENAIAWEYSKTPTDDPKAKASAQPDLKRPVSQRYQELAETEPTVARTQATRHFSYYLLAGE